MLCTERTVKTRAIHVVRALSLAIGLIGTGIASAAFDAAGYYEMRCATCHGANGEGTRDRIPPLAPPLRGNPLVVNAPAAVLIQVIRKGRSGRQRVYNDTYTNMPSFGPEAVPDPEALVEYLKTSLQQ